jgi:hypothetical protein
LDEFEYGVELSSDDDAERERRAKESRRVYKMKEGIGRLHDVFSVIITNKLLGLCLAIGFSSGRA